MLDMNYKKYTDNAILPMICGILLFSVFVLSLLITVLNVCTLESNSTFHIIRAMIYFVIFRSIASYISLLLRAWHPMLRRYLFDVLGYGFSGVVFGAGLSHLTIHGYGF